MDAAHPAVSAFGSQQYFMTTSPRALKFGRSWSRANPPQPICPITSFPSLMLSLSQTDPDVRIIPFLRFALRRKSGRVSECMVIWFTGLSPRFAMSGMRTGGT